MLRDYLQVPAARPPGPFAVRDRQLYRGDELLSWDHPVDRFVENGEQALCVSGQQLVLLNLKTQDSRVLGERSGHLVPGGLSPDGKQALFSESSTNRQGDLFMVDLESGATRHLTPHRGEARYSGARFDGDSVLVLTNQDREFIALCRLDPATGQLSPVVEAPWDVEQFAVRGDSLAYTLNEDGYSRLYVDGRRVELPDGVIRSLSDDLSVILDSPDAGPRRYQVEDGIARLVEEVSLNGLPVVKPSQVSIPAHDGRQIPALLYPGPPGAPVVIDLHGGPEAQMRPSYQPVHQYLAAQGYTVLAPNVRGSTGYGRSYAAADDGAKRADAIKDVSSAARFAGAASTVVMGVSHGGYLALAALAFDPEQFDGAVSISGMSNLESFMASERGPARVHEYGNDAAVLRELSPRAEQIQAPVLLLHGVQDTAVHSSQSSELAQALEAQGKPVELMLFGDEGHGLTRHQLEGYSAVARFLKETAGR